MNKLLLYLVLGVLSLLVLVSLQPSSSNLDYVVHPLPSFENAKATYIPTSKVLKVIANVICCADGINVEKQGNDIVIRVVDYDNEVCKCFETKEILITGINTIPQRVVFVNYDGKTSELPLEVSEFCGTSTFGKCRSDEDRVITGCSREVCASRYEEQVYSPCIQRNCYDYKKYGVSCRCVLGRCMWA